MVRVDSQYYVYGSNNNLRAPVTETLDITRYYTLQDKNRITHEGMPNPAPWAARRGSCGHRRSGSSARVG